MTDITGIHRLSEADYHGDRLTPEPSLSSTLARTLVNRSPLHAWTQSQRLNPEYEAVHSEAFDIGKCFHSMILGQGCEMVVVDAENWTTKAARAARDEARALGMVPLLPDQFAAATAMHAAVLIGLEPFGLNFDDTACSEIAAFGQIDNVWCRALIDHAPLDPAAPLIDIKTTTDASPDACIRAVTSYGYDAQQAHYQAVWQAATGERRGFRFVFVEKTPPFGVSVVELHDDPDDPADWMLSARDKMRTARFAWRRCLDSGRWPGYPPQVAVVGAPTYHTARWENRAKPAAETIARATAWQSGERA